MKTALLLIDIQNDYFPEGKMELYNMEHSSEKARELLNDFRSREYLVIHVQHISVKPGAKFFLPDTEGVNIHESVKPLENEIIIKKHYPNSFRDTGLKQVLDQSEITHLIISGAMSHMCIDSTTRMAFDYGYKCTVVSDGCATKDLSFGGEKVPAVQVHNAYMAGLDGLFAEVLPLQQVWQSAID